MAVIEDVAPALLEQLQQDFRSRVQDNRKLQDLLKLVNDGKATYIQAEELACEMGEVLSQTFGNCLSSAVLPDGKMYYNIAQRVVAPMLQENHQLIAQATEQVQAALNKKAGIGLKPQTVAVDEDRIYGIVNKISEAEVYDDVAWVLGEPVVNFSQAVVDSILKANVDFQGKAGLTPKLYRKAERKCCKWCRGLAGVYDYPMVPDDVYRRHENCRCTVEYDPGDGRRQNVHTKRLTTPGERDILEERKRSRLSDLGVFRPNEYETTVNSLVKVDRGEVVKAAKAGKKHGHGGVFFDAQDKSKKELQKSIISHVSQVETHNDKLKHPEKYVLDWEKKDPRYQQGLLKKWEKDMRRNAEQAEIELAVFEERFGQ